MIGTDEWRSTDDYLMAFLGRVTVDRMSEFERSLFRHHRYMALRESK